MNFKRIKYILFHNFFFKLRLFLSFVRNFFIKKKIIKINQDLILIGQIQRSGGSLLTQLFDSHKNLYTYPNELILSKSRYQWSKNNIYNTLSVNEGMRINYLKNNYTKLGPLKPHKVAKNTFNFNPFLEKKIFSSLFNGLKKNQKNNFRTVLNIYFTSFFNSLLNYKNFKGKKKYIISFLPRFIFYKKNIDIFFKAYPKSYIIIIIRDPEQWLNSAKIIFKNKNSKYLLNEWNNNLNLALRLKKKYKKQILLVSFLNLKNNTKKTMFKICKKIKIKYYPSLNSPTFNGFSLQSNSSHRIIYGKIDRDKNLKNFSNNEKLILKIFSKKFKNIYKKLI